MLSRPLHLAAIAMTVALLACAAPALAGPPPNDGFANATTLTADASTGMALPNQTLDGATAEAGEPPHFGGDQTVWYRWVPPYTGTADIDICNASSSLQIDAFYGATLPALTYAGSEPLVTCAFGNDVGVHVTAGQELRVRVRGYAPALTGTHFTVRLNHPYNDDLADAKPLTDFYFSAIARLIGATKQAGEPAHAGDTGGHSVWFSWTSGAAGPAKFSTCSALTKIDTLLGAYFGNGFPLVSLGSSDDDLTCDVNSRASTMSFAAAPHTTYKIALDAYHGVAPADLAGTAQLYFPPANDHLADAQPTSGSGEFASWGYTATKQVGEPDHAGSPGGASTWTAWTATRTGPVTIDTCASYSGAPDTLLAVYTGDSYPLSPVASNDDTTRCGDGKASLVTFDATAGTTYKVATDIKGGSGDFEFINVDPPDNDWFAHPTALTGSGVLTVNNSMASTEPGEPKHADVDASQSLWFAYTAPADGLVHLDTCGTSYVSTALEVDTGESLGGLTPVAASRHAKGCGQYDVGSSIDFNATAGTTYRIALDAIFGSGPMVLAYSGPGAPAPTGGVVAPAPTGAVVTPPAHGPGPLLSGLKLGRAQLRRLLAGRYVATVTCLRACTLQATLRAHGHVIASGATAKRAAGTARVRLHVAPRRRPALRRLNKLRAAFTLVAIDPATHAAAHAGRTVRFRR